MRQLFERDSIFVLALKMAHLTDTNFDATVKLIRKKDDRIRMMENTHAKKVNFDFKKIITTILKIEAEKGLLSQFLHRDSSQFRKYHHH